MGYEQLSNYIKQARAAGQTDEQIKSALIQRGWAQTDIDEGFNTPEISVVDNGENCSSEVQGRDANGEYAGFWVRVAAYLIDFLIIGLAVVVLITLLFMIVSGGSGFPAKGAVSTFTVFSATMIYMLCLVFLTIFYPVWMTKKYGATLGKMAMKIKVVSDKSAELSWGQVILREIIKGYISGLLFIGYILIIFSDRKQSLHDMLAKTLVAQRDPQNKASKGSIGLVLGIGLFVLIVIPFFLGIVLGFKNAREKMQAGQKISGVQEKDVDFAVEYACAFAEAEKELGTGSGVEYSSRVYEKMKSMQEKYSINDIKDFAGKVDDINNLKKNEEFRKRVEDLSAERGCLSDKNILDLPAGREGSQGFRLGNVGTKTIDGVRADFSIDSDREGMCGTGITQGRKTIETGHEISFCVKTLSCCDKIYSMDFDFKNENKLNRILLKYNHEENADCSCPGTFVQLIYKITNLPEGEMKFNVVKNQSEAKIVIDDPYINLSEEEKLQRMYDVACAATKIWVDEASPQTDNHRQFASDTAKPVMEKYNLSYEQLLTEWSEQELLNPELRKKIQEKIMLECFKESKK